MILLSVRIVALMAAIYGAIETIPEGPNPVAFTLSGMGIGLFCALLGGGER